MNNSTLEKVTGWKANQMYSYHGNYIMVSGGKLMEYNDNLGRWLESQRKINDLPNILALAKRLG